MNPAKVIITLEGLMLLCFNKRQANGSFENCQIGINNIVTDPNDQREIHNFTVGYKVTDSNGMVFMVAPHKYKYDELNDQPSFWLEVLDQTGKPVERKVERQFGDKVLDLEGPQFTKSKLHNNKQIPSLFITQGVFNVGSEVTDKYFRTPCPDVVSAYNQFRPNGVSDEEVSLLKALGVIIDDIWPFAKTVKADFDLPEGHQLVLKTKDKQDTTKEVILFNITGKTGLTIELSIKNLEDSRVDNGKEESRHFLHHYKYFNMDGKTEYGLVSLTKMPDSGGSRKRCKNDGCNLAQLGQRDQEMLTYK